MSPLEPLPTLQTTKKESMMAEDDPLRTSRRNNIVPLIPLLPFADIGNDIEKTAEAIESQYKTGSTGHSNRQHRVGRAHSAGTTEGQFARMLIAERRQREQLFGANLFSDPAWDILLNLFVTYDERKTVSISNLCIAAAVPDTTGLRWINNLEAKHMLLKREDPHDGRRVWIELAPHIAGQMRHLLRSWLDESE